MKNKSTFIPADSCRRLSVAAVLGGSVVFAMTGAAQDVATWNGSASGDWSNPSNWNSSFVPNGNDEINVAGSSNLTMNNDLTGAALNQYRLFFNTGAGAFTLGGNALAFYDFGGNAPKIENNSASLQTINLNLTMDGAGTGGGAEINPVSGDFHFGGSVTLADTTVLNIWGSNGRTVTFNSGLNAATFGQLILNQKSTTVLNGTSSFGGENNLTNSNGNITIGSNAVDTGATLTINGAVSGVDNISLRKGTLNINSGATLSAVRFITSDDSGATNTINQTGGAFNVSGNVNSGTSSSFVLGHWPAASTYNMSGGSLNVPNAPLNLGWDGQATFNQTGGTANLQGINFNNGRNNTALYDVATGGRLNIGSYGMNGNASAKTMRLSGGTLGAYADWTGTQNIVLSATSAINTLDSADNTTARTITLNNVVSGAGGLTKSGAGTLVLTGGDDTYSGATVVNGGALRINGPVRSSSTFTANAGATLELNGVNLFVGGHGIALPDAKTLNANGGTLLMTASFDARFGNVNLSNGATWTSNRVLTNYDAYIAATASGASPTITVANTGGNTSPSGMTGSSSTGIHLGGVTNFSVSDVTGSAATDLTVSMRLDNGGTTGGTGSVVKAGGGTMLFIQQMAYTGGTTVNAGVLAVDGNQEANRLTTNHLVTVNNTGTFEIRGVNALPNGGNSVDFTVNAGGTLNIVSGGSAAIGSGGTSHAHVRNLTLNGGTVAMAYSGAGGAYNGESFQLNGDVAVGGNAPTAITSSTTAGLSGVALNGNRTFTVADVTGSSASDLIISAELENTDSTPADDGFTKVGAGTMELAAGVTHSYSGATSVSAGTLLVNGVLGDTAVTVGASGTIGGTGTLGGTLAFDAGAKLDLAGATLGLNSADILTVAAGKAITLTDFAFSNIIGWNAANADAGTYELIKGGGTVTFNGTTPTVSSPFAFGNGKTGYFEQGSLRAVIIPEHSVALLGGLGVIGLLRRRRQS